MNSVALLWCLMVLPNGQLDSQVTDHSIMLSYDDIANKTVVYKIVYYSFPHDLDNTLIAVINTNDHPNIEEYLTIAYRDVIIKETKTVTIQEQH